MQHKTPRSLTKRLNKKNANYYTVKNQNSFVAIVLYYKFLFINGK